MRGTCVMRTWGRVASNPYPWRLNPARGLSHFPAYIGLGGLCFPSRSSRGEFDTVDQSANQKDSSPPDTGMQTEQNYGIWGCVEHFPNASAQIRIPFTKSDNPMKNQIEMTLSLVLSPGPSYQKIILRMKKIIITTAAQNRGFS